MRFINWAKNSGNTNVALLKHGGLNWANNLDPNDLSKEDYKKLFRALSYSVDTATIDREGYNLYKKIKNALTYLLSISFICCIS